MGTRKVERREERGEKEKEGGEGLVNICDLKILF